jgi:U3 small nucleolar RNA-associated protein 23
LHASTSDMALVPKPDPSVLPKKKKKGPKEPNPLSIKKKKPKVVVPAPSAVSPGESTAPLAVSSRKLSEPARQLAQGPEESRSTRPGEKRVRSEEDDGGDEGHGDGAASTTGGRKRKRRRKGASVKDDVEAQAA